MHLIVFARAVRAASSQAILSTCGSRYSIGSWLAAFHGNSLSSPIYYIHMVISISYYSPFPYSFGSRVGYFVICYIAPVSVSPFRGVFRSQFFQIVRLLFRCSRLYRHLACSFISTDLQADFPNNVFCSMSICLQSLSVLRCRLAPAVCLALSLLAVFIPQIEAAKGIEP